MRDGWAGPGRARRGVRERPGLAFLTCRGCAPALQVNTRVLIDEIRLKKPAATLDDFPDADLERIAGDGYDFVYFLGVWQTGEFGMKKSIKLLDLEPCMKVPRPAPPHTSSNSLRGRVRAEEARSASLDLFTLRCPVP